MFFLSLFLSPYAFHFRQYCNVATNFTRFRLIVAFVHSEHFYQIREKVIIMIHARRTRKHVHVFVCTQKIDGINEWTVQAKYIFYKKNIKWTKNKRVTAIELHRIGDCCRLTHIWPKPYNMIVSCNVRAKFSWDRWHYCEHSAFDSIQKIDISVIESKFDKMCKMGTKRTPNKYQIILTGQFATVSIAKPTLNEFND